MYVYMCPFTDEQCYYHIVVGIAKRSRAALTLPIGRNATATATATDTAAETL